MKKPKICICCGGTYAAHGPKDTYRCKQCKHIYRHSYITSALETHSLGGTYRNKEYDVENETFQDLEKLKGKKHLIIRAERVKKQLDTVINFFSKSDTVLEVASGKGFMLTQLLDYFDNVTGMDLHPYVKNYNKKNNPRAEFIVCDFLEFPEENKYDVIFAMDVMEHIEDANKFVNKMAALANKYVVVQVPVDRSLKLVNNKSKGFDGHVHYFSEESLKSVFTKNNLFQCEFIYKSKRHELANGPELIAVFKRTV